MKESFLQILICPICRAPLTLITKEVRDNIIQSGDLHCTKCRHAYPIANGIPSLLDPSLPNFEKKMGEVNGWVTLSSQEKWYIPDETIDLHLPYVVRDLGWTDSVWWATQISFDHMRAVCVKKGMNILEVGAARCWGGRYFLERGCEYTACDMLADPNIGLGRGQFYINHFGYFERAQADAERLPFRNGAFDLTYGIATLHHALNLRAMIGEMARVTKRGGYVVALNEGSRPFFAGSDAEIQSDEKKHGINEHVHYPTTYLREFWRHGLFVHSFRRAIGYENLIGGQLQRRAKRLLGWPFGQFCAAMYVLGFGGYDGVSLIAKKLW